MRLGRGGGGACGSVLGFGLWLHVFRHPIWGRQCFRRGSLPPKRPRCWRGGRARPAGVHLRTPSPVRPGLSPGVPGADRSPAGVQPAPGPAAEPGPQGRRGGGGGGGGRPGLHAHRRARREHLRGCARGAGGAGPGAPLTGPRSSPGPVTTRREKLPSPLLSVFFLCSFLPSVSDFSKRKKKYPKKNCL